MVNVCADLEDCFAKSNIVSGTRSSHHFVAISCNLQISSKFLQFDFDKPLTEEIDIKKSIVFQVSAVSMIHFGGLAW